MNKQVAVAIVFGLSVIILWLSMENRARRSPSPHFCGVGDLPGGSFYSAASGVSADGSVVVGYSNSAAGMEAFRWTSGHGITGLKFSHASAVSDDGSVVVGHATTGSRTEPVRWTALDGAQVADTWPELNDTSACDVSASGDVIVGFASSAGPGADRREMAFLWSAQRGFARLKHSEEENVSSEARAVSSDGKVVAGAVRLESGHSEAFRWSRQSGLVRLGFLPGHTTSVAHGISADGSVVVGKSGNYIHSEAFRWTEQSGMVGLGSLRDRPGDGAAFDVSADGSVIVGFSTGAAGWEAFIWDLDHGMRSMREVLERDYKLGVQVLGWNLRSASTVSDDGTTVAGSGLNPHGNYEAWIARLGERSPAIVPGTIGGAQTRAGDIYFGIRAVTTSSSPFITSTLSSMRIPPASRQRSR
jgi:probable HAF family extracellular repeat protein